MNRSERSRRSGNRRTKPRAAPSTIEVRHGAPTDLRRLARLRHALWPEGSEAEHRRELERFFAGRPAAAGRQDEGRSGLLAVLVAEDRSGLLGFAELSIRPYAEGCRTDRVGFLEGWFVVPGARKRGIGRRLMAAAEAWARSAGCVEFGSDAEADNRASAAAHRALGFEEVGLVRCFRKDL
jgi:aminoglycoside 6'-N-acetyltransferase I